VTGPDPTPYPLDHLVRHGAMDDIALISGEERLTYRALDDAIGRTASALLHLGLSRGDRVATWMGKTGLACIMPLAAARAGLVHVPINPVLKHAQAAHILADSGARLLVANKARLDSLGPGDLADAVAVALEEWQDGEEGLSLSSNDPGELVALLAVDVPDPVLRVRVRRKRAVEAHRHRDRFVVGDLPPARVGQRHDIP